MSASTGRAGSAVLSVFWWEDAILLFLKCRGFFFESRLVLLVLLMLMNQVACGDNFEASKENHGDEFVELRVVFGTQMRDLIGMGECTCTSVDEVV